MLEHVLRRLMAAGVTEVIINVHHFADQIADFLKNKSNFGIRIELSYEEQLLDTGGGLKKAGYFLDDSEPFFLHNVDIVSDIDLNKMHRGHVRNNPLATLAVMQRESSRFLLFDQKDNLCGWKALKSDQTVMLANTKGPIQDLAFCGIHVISPSIFEKFTERGAFSIISSYVRLAELGERILAFRADDYQWQDGGKLEDLRSAQK
ncbi:nucleotidyltransferase family protein [candidate division KSB1 bacterium]|nr:nucleotidyltransferase family protein [candidate division KSB1 bacterium]